jgi:adenylate kinase
MEYAGCNLIILGPPGAGKGTQARVVAQRLGIPHIDCGRVVRDEVAAGSEFGLKAEEFMVAGRLVPDELIVGIMLKRLSEPDCSAGFVLDGFPRTIEQAKGLDDYLASSGGRLDYIVYVGLDEGTAVVRLGSRRYCPVCGRVFNVLSAPPEVEGKCDDCGGELVLRPDDRPETVIERLRVYEAETAPLVEHYRTAGGYLEMDGRKDAAEVTEQIIKAIHKGGRCN